MERSAKRTGAVGAAFVVGRNAAPARYAALRSQIRSQNARVSRLASAFRRGRLRRRNAVTAGYLGIEVKYYDTFKAATVLAAPATPDNTARFNPATRLCLNAVSQGDGPTNRDGRKIRLRSLYIKGTIYREGLEAQAGSQEPISGYVAIVLDRQANASEIVPDQVYTSPQGTAFGNSCLFRNLEYSNRYRILRDQVFTFGGGPEAGVTGSLNPAGLAKHFEWYIPLNFDTLFNTEDPTNATIADIVSNAIGVVALATISAAPNTLALAYSSRIRFVG